MKISITKLFTSIADLVFPPRNDELIVRSLSSENLNILYAPIEVDTVIALCRFSNPHIRALIHEAKYEKNSKAQRLLASLLEIYVNKNPELRNAVWVPIPLSRPRERERGYNQVTEILSYTSFNVQKNTLKRVRNTTPQTTLNRQERLLNVRNAFVAENHELLPDTDVVIIDDVVTTGATLKNAHDALLLKRPRSITLFAIAH